jgi:hypothetical protein
MPTVNWVSDTMTNWLGRSWLGLPSWVYSAGVTVM